MKWRDIYRVFYNFIKKSDDGKTPAIRLGLAKGAIRYERYYLLQIKDLGRAVLGSHIHAREKCDIFS